MCFRLDLPVAQVIWDCRLGLIPVVSKRRNTSLFMVALAQSGRAVGCDPAGRRFESDTLPQYLVILEKNCGTQVTDDLAGRKQKCNMTKVAAAALEI